MKPRSQTIATLAFERVKYHKERKSFEENKKYASLVHKLPALILQNGLAQTTGFLLAKGEAHHQELLRDLTLIFKKMDADFGGIADKDAKAFHAIVIESDLYQIIRMTREALEITGWLRRYVQGVLKIDATGESIELNSVEAEEYS